MAKPWDLFNPKQPRSTEELVAYRLGICDTCPSFLDMTQQCKECGCIMPLKTKLENATCPLGKW